MFLQDIFDQLTSGEFRKTSLGGSKSSDKTIKPEDYPVIIPAINLAILETHKRLLLRMQSITVMLHGNITMYRMHPDHAYTNKASTEVKYLADSIHFPFEDTFLTAEHVYDANGLRLPMNDYNDLDSVYTPTHNIVQHPFPTRCHTMDVVYRAGLPKIPIDLNINPREYFIDMPDYALVPVLAYILSRNDIGMIRGENIQADLQALIKFETACQSIERSSLIHRETYTNTNIKDNGWL